MKFKVNKFDNGNWGISIWKDGMTGEYIELPTKEELESGCFVNSHQTSEVAAIKDAQEQLIKDLCRLLQTGHIIGSLVADYKKRLQTLIETMGWKEIDRKINIGLFAQKLAEVAERDGSILGYLQYIQQYLPQEVDALNIELLLAKGQYDD